MSCTSSHLRAFIPPSLHTFDPFPPVISNVSLEYFKGESYSRLPKHSKTKRREVSPPLLPPSLIWHSILSYPLYRLLQHPRHYPSTPWLLRHHVCLPFHSRLKNSLVVVAELPGKTVTLRLVRANLTASNELRSKLGRLPPEFEVFVRTEAFFQNQHKYARLFRDGKLVLIV